MRGFPPIHLILFALAFVVLAIPLSRLTFARPAVTAPPQIEKTEAAATPTLIRLRFAHVPASISVKLGEKELLSAKSSAQTAAIMEARAEFEIAKEGIELLVRATWPEGTPDTAVTMELEPDGLDAQSQTRWSSGAKLDEIFTFHWKP